MKMRAMRVLLVSLFIVMTGIVMPVNAQQQVQSITTDNISKIKSANKIIVGMNLGYKPFEYRGINDEIMGFDVDIAKELASALGVQLEIKTYDRYEDLIPGVGGDIDVIISGMTRTLDRSLLVNFTEPYFKTGQIILLSDKNNKIKDWKELNAAGKKIIVVQGTTSQQIGDVKMNKAKIIRAANEAEAIDMLTKNSGDALLYDKPFIEALCSTHPGWKVLPEQLSYELYCFAVPKKDSDFLLWLNNFIEELKMSGKYDDIYKKWFTGNPVCP